MKIIHTADLHLDSPLEKNLNPIKVKERKKELLVNFERLVTYANANDVNAIIIAGDMFDKPRISNKVISYILDIIHCNKNIDFFYASGNHDENFYIDNLSFKPENLYTFDSKWKTIDYKGIDITGIVYNTSNSNTMYDTLLLNRDKLNIVILHGQIATSVDAGIKLSQLQDKGIDYLALGHIHKYTYDRIDDRGVYVYPGCLEGRGFDEIGPKGFSLIEIENNRFKSEFVKFARRELHEVSVDITGLDTWLEIKKEIQSKIDDISKDDMVKVILVGYYKVDLIKQIELLEDYLDSLFYFAKVEDLSKLEINPRDYENDISLKGEFIRNVLTSDLSIEEKNQIIEFGIKALMKEEI